MYIAFYTTNVFWLFKEVLFINNLQIGRFEPSHVWTVATEFQGYLITPFLVKWMYRS